MSGRFRLAAVTVAAAATLAVGYGVWWIGGEPRWPRAAPEETGFDAERLRSLAADLEARDTNALLVLRHGAVAYEWYAPGRGPRLREGAASLTKALVGSVAALVAATDGRIAWSQPVATHVAAWRGDSLRERIRYRDLLAHSSGLPRARGETPPEWAARFWDLDATLFEAVLAEAPVAFPPGSRTEYSGPGYAVLSYALTASLRGSRWSDLRALLRDRVMRPLGIPDRTWTIGYDGPFHVDGMEVYATWGGAAFTARAAARIGELMLHHGRWGGRALLDSTLVANALAPAVVAAPAAAGAGSAEPATAMGWWSNREGAWASVPRDAFAGAGADGQVVLVVPSLDLIVVRFGRRFDPGADLDVPWEDLDRYVFRPVMEAVRTGGGAKA
jgi:CubicO group peptidase (beta-lactamase class C family)